MVSEVYLFVEHGLAPMGPICSVDWYPVVVVLERDGSAYIHPRCLSGDSCGFHGSCDCGERHNDLRQLS